MVATLLDELFHISKPVIGMAHFPPLPGTPLYDPRLGVEGTIQQMREDVDKLISNGVNGILFCNEGDRPYTLKADFEAVAVMTRVITEIAPRERSLGIDFLWDPKAPLPHLPERSNLAAVQSDSRTTCV